MINEIKTKYMVYQQIESPGKTEVWNILNKSSGIKIAKIKWYPAWRQYCFFPEFDTVFNPTCMAEIIQFIKGRMVARNSKND